MFNSLHLFFFFVEKQLFSSSLSTYCYFSYYVIFFGCLQVTSGVGIYPQVQFYGIITQYYFSYKAFDDYVIFFFLWLTVVT